MIGDGAVGVDRQVLTAPLVVAVLGGIVVGAEGPERDGGRVGQAGEVEIVLILDVASGLVEEGAREGADVGDGLGAGGDVAAGRSGDVRRGGHGQGLGVAASPVLAGDLGGPGGGAGGGIPAGIDADLVVGVVVDGVRDVAGRAGLFGGPAQAVDLVEGDQVEAAAGGGGPAGGEAGELGGLGGVDVDDRLDDGAGGVVVGGVVDEAVAVFGPGGAAVGVIDGGGDVGGARPVLAGGDHGRGDGGREDLVGAGVPGVGVGGGLGAGAVGVAVDGRTGDGVDRVAGGVGVAEVLGAVLEDGRAGVAVLDRFALEVSGDVAGRGAGGGGGGAVGGQADEAGGGREVLVGAGAGIAGADEVGVGRRGGVEGGKVGDGDGGGLGRQDRAAGVVVPVIGGPDVAVECGVGGVAGVVGGGEKDLAVGVGVDDVLGVVGEGLDGLDGPGVLAGGVGAVGVGVGIHPLAGRAGAGAAGALDDGLGDTMVGVVLVILVGVGCELGVGGRFRGDAGGEVGGEAGIGLGVELVFEAADIADGPVVEVGLGVVAIVGRADRRPGGVLERLLLQLAGVALGLGAVVVDEGDLLDDGQRAAGGATLQGDVGDEAGVDAAGDVGVGVGLDGGAIVDADRRELTGGIVGRAGGVAPGIGHRFDLAPLGGGDVRAEAVEVDGRAVGLGQQVAARVVGGEGVLVIELGRVGGAVVVEEDPVAGPRDGDERAIGARLDPGQVGVIHARAEVGVIAGEVGPSEVEAHARVDEMSAGGSGGHARVDGGHGGGVGAGGHARVELRDGPWVGSTSTVLNAGARQGAGVRDARARAGRAPQRFDRAKRAGLSGRVGRRRRRDAQARQGERGRGWGDVQGFERGDATAGAGDRQADHLGWRQRADRGHRDCPRSHFECARLADASPPLRQRKAAGVIRAGRDRDKSLDRGIRARVRDREAGVRGRDADRATGEELAGLESLDAIEAEGRIRAATAAHGVSRAMGGEPRGQRNGEECAVILHAGRSLGSPHRVGIDAASCSTLARR